MLNILELFFLHWYYVNSALLKQPDWGRIAVWLAKGYQIKSEEDFDFQEPESEGVSVFFGVKEILFAVLCFSMGNCLS